jgi:hypothetical protein
MGVPTAIHGNADLVVNLDTKTHRGTKPPLSIVLARGSRAQGFGKCSAITPPSVSVRSVWYRMTARLCCCRPVGVHMTRPRLVQETPWNHGRLTP